MLFSFFWISKSSFLPAGLDVDRLLREMLRELRLRLRDFPLRCCCCCFLVVAPAPEVDFFLLRSTLPPPSLDEERDESELREERRRAERERDLRGLRSFDLDLDLDLDRDRLVLFFRLWLTDRDLDVRDLDDRDRLRLDRRFPATAEPEAADTAAAPGSPGFLPSAMFINLDCSFEMAPPLSVGFSLGGAFLFLGGLRERFRPLSRGRPSRSRLSLGDRLRFLERSVDLLCDLDRRRSRDDFRSRDDRLSRERRRDRERSRELLRRDLSRFDE